MKFDRCCVSIISNASAISSTAIGTAEAIFLMIWYIGVDAETFVLLYAERQIKVARFG